MINKPVTIKAAWISAIALIIVAIITGIFTLFTKEPHVNNSINSDVKAFNSSKINVSNNQNEIKGDFVNGKKNILNSKTINDEENIKINAPKALIVTQKQTGGTNTVNINQITSQSYQLISLEIKDQLNHNLNSLIIHHRDNPKLIIEIESGNSMRDKIARDFENILIPKNLGYYPKGNTFLGRFPDHPISLFSSIKNLKFTIDFLNSIKPYIESEFFVDTSFKSNEIVRFYINGTPTFSSNGKVKIE